MKTHRTDGLSLVFGLVFLTVVVWWGVAQIIDVSLPHPGWFVAIALIVLGLLGLVGAVRSHRTPEVPPPDVPARGIPTGVNDASERPTDAPDER
jgi:hypothetical protein